jgi:hypothetical protein
MMVYFFTIAPQRNLIKYNKILKAFNLQHIGFFEVLDLGTMNTSYKDQLIKSNVQVTNTKCYQNRALLIVVLFRNQDLFIEQENLN